MAGIGTTVIRVIRRCIEVFCLLVFSILMYWCTINCVTIINIKAWQYTIPLSPPIRIRETQYDTRSGFMIGLVTDSGYVGFGEVAPLPGMSLDTLTECESAFLQIISMLYFIETPQTVPELLKIIDRIHQSHPLPIALQHGLEMAFLTLMSHQSQCLIAQLLNPKFQPIIPRHCLLNGSFETVLERYRTQSKLGYTRFKLKVGHLNERDTRQHLVEFFKQANPEHRFWLDANRQWPLQTAINFGSSVQNLPIEYIEEPIECSDELSQFYEATGMTIGLDETLIENTESWDLSGASHLIIKPMCVGLSAIIDLYTATQNTPKQLVISSSYDSPITHYYYAQLCAAFSTQSIGLDAQLYPNHPMYATPSVDLNQYEPPTHYDLPPNLVRWTLP